MNSDTSLYKRAIIKYGEKYKPIFSMLPDEIIEQYLYYDYLAGIKKLNHDFKSILEVKNKNQKC